jgi:hypothetical protein
MLSIGFNSDGHLYRVSALDTKHSVQYFTDCDRHNHSE